MSIKPFKCFQCEQTIEDETPATHTEDGFPVCTSCAEKYQLECDESRMADETPISLDNPLL